MTTFNIATNFPTGKFHKRQSGLWGQLRASAEIEAKQARVEPLFKELHGRGLNRTAFYGKCRELARQGKSDVGGYLQYMTQDMAGILLGHMHREIGKAVRRNRTLKNPDLKTKSVVFEIGEFTIDTSDFVKNFGGGKKMVDGFATKDSKTYKLYKAMVDRKYPVTKDTLMKQADIQTAAHFYDTVKVLRGKGFKVETLRSKHISVAPKYQIAG